MAKVGMSAFLLDCRTNENISEIEAEYGVKGFAVVVRLWQKIYAEKGYYCEWSGRSPLLFLSDWFGGNSGVTVSLINGIVERCLKNGIFNNEMYERYQILTSARIQRQYFDYAKRRETIYVVEEYLLVSVDKIKGIAYKNDVSVCRNSKNVCRNDITKHNKTKHNLTKDRESVKHLGDFISAYPKDCNQHLTKKEYQRLVTDGMETEENLVACARNYADSCKALEKPERYIKNAENFLKEFVFEGYLPGKYKKPVCQKKKNSFSSFPQREYDMNELERKLLNKNAGGG